MKKMVLFGAGQNGKNVYDFLEFYHYETYVYAFCDNNLARGGLKERMLFQLKS